MLSLKYTVDRTEGFHLRPAGVLSKTVSEYDCQTNVIFNDNTINAKSVMSIVAACIKNGSEIVFECDGPDEQKCIEAIKQLIENGFGEN